LAHADQPVRELFATAAALTRHRALHLAAQRAGVEVTVVDERVIAQLSDSVTPQGLVAVVGVLACDLDSVLVRRPRLLVVLAEARDPGNAGSVIRVADAAGADAVILTRGSVDPWGQKAVRASAGSVLHLPIVTGVEAPAVVAALRAAHVGVIAADGEASLKLDDAEALALLSKPTAWLFGNEAWGLPPAVRGLADHVIAVPIHGRAESLNLATAAALCLYAAAGAQRRA
jgi:TrmH family RNA methyltransferase